MIHRKELDYLMGMSEMESAIEVMLQKSESSGVPFQEIYMLTSEMWQEAVGFCQLLGRGWMSPSYPNGQFVVSKCLVERMRQRECWKGMPDPPTFEERMAKYCPIMLEPLPPVLAERVQRRDP